MTEPQFAYNGFTLDELRSLAASPQVGTLQAMPQTFRDLANRVGEVADLLSHAQADLPNWWKGPAAEQAAATLGRAAAEARDFHESAMGAAMAVSRCAQVVAEQQHQMMNVPEVAEPGITAVVQRPATPFDALEAARQDAAYQAAHEQAVQVVNGIAAQYVETREELAMTGVPRGENFQPLKATNHSIYDATTPVEGHSPVGAALSAATSTTTRRASQFSNEASEYRGIGIAGRVPSMPAQSARHPSIKSGSPAPTESSSGFPLVRFAAPVDMEHAAIPSKPKTFSGRVGNPESATGHNHTSPANPTELAPQSDAAISIGAPRTYEAANTRDTHVEYERGDPVTAASSKKKSRHTYTKERSSTSSMEVDFPQKPEPDDARPAEPTPTYNPSPENKGDNNSAMIPPYCGAGSVRRERENRSPRPTYLKERKSVWVPDTVAAPADGVISLDWFEQP